MKPIPAAPLAFVLLAWAATAQGASAVQFASAHPLADLTLEQLSHIEVTSVSGRPQGLMQAAASIYVITAQDIRRSAATSLPEVLRLAPNLQVAQTSAGQWAISARGFQDSIANKLLVLVDGRTVYSPLFAGVFWDANDLVLEDVDRIEVISGPGGTLWGANAVNGVINVVTRNAAETQGVLALAARSGHGGREVVRWGGRIGPDAHLRIHGLAVDRDNTWLPGGAPRDDASNRLQGGFRADWADGPSALTLQGEAYRGGELPSNNLAPELRGQHLLGRWSSRFADGSSYTLQAYYDGSERDDGNLFRNHSRTVDLRFTHEPRGAGPGQLLWGAGHRRARDSTQPTPMLAFLPAERTLSWTHAFAQYQWMLGDQLQATAGAKVEHNSYTGAELLPSVRLAWLHSPQATTWAALSRAVRAPARIDRDFFLTLPPGIAVIAGGPDFRSETATVLEAGHRAQLSPTLSWSATVFRHFFHGLRSGRPGQAPPATVENLVEGPVDGLEAWGQWQPLEGWRLSAGYLALHKDLRFAGGLSPATRSFPGLGNDPRSQVSLRSSLDVGANGAFDLAVRRVGELTDPRVPGYTAVDARLGWQVRPDLRLELLGTNLLGRRHVEFAGGSEIGRRLLLQLTWQLEARSR
ncbi:TonB-dependent receptor [Ramlibacter tataouinensis]|uniref:TonB-dependent receptor plug domain-containing protein n=1 Tax=Ramlibacter tataouinensis TaxID=94132 RepID=UPI0022F39FA8|nr:TonB-dependent receptor [Ramlibacter tataouinensis]WBY01716.1 TonB-dependent receptor [Ramlibacter tataouinensis]